MSHNPESTTRGRGARRTMIIGGLLIAAATGGVAFYNMRPKAAALEAAQAGPAEPGRIKYTVRRENLTVSSLCAGELKTKNSITISNQVDRTLKVTWIVEEGKQVRKGDKLVEFDGAELTEQLLRQRIRMAEVNQSYQKALDDQAISENKGKTELVSAQNSVKIAELDLKKYTEGDYLQEKRKKESAVALAEEKLRRAEDKLAWTKKLAEKGYVTQIELEGDEFSVKSTRIELDTAREDLKLLERYARDRETAQLETKRVEAQGKLEQVKLQGQREQTTSKALVEAAKATRELEQIKLNDLENQVKNCVLTAPEDGMVVYVTDRWRGNEQQLQVGQTISPRQRIIELPDFSSWKIAARVHESRIQQIKPGQRAFVSLDAFSDNVVQGEVKRISVLPDKSNWWSTSQDYIVDVDMSERNANFKPGMSAKAEIILAEIPDALVAPIQAIHMREGKTMVWAATETGTAPVEVVVGRNNDRYVEIVSGLTEGQVIFLDQPVEPGPVVGARPATRATQEQRSAAADAAKAAEVRMAENAEADKKAEGKRKKKDQEKPKIESADADEEIEKPSEPVKKRVEGVAEAKGAERPSVGE